MFTRQNVVRGFLWPSLFALLVIFNYQSCKPDDDDGNPSAGFSLELIPNADQELYSYETMRLFYDPEYEVQILDIRYEAGSQAGSLIDEDTPIRREVGYFEFTFCAECQDASQVTFRITATDGLETVTLEETFAINHLPVVAVSVLAIGTEFVILNAEESFDPEGETLNFTWHLGDEQFDGPVLETEFFRVIEQPILLTVDDGVTTVDDVVTYDPETREVFYTPDNLKCTAMEIATDNKSLLNPEFSLGALPAVGTVLPIDADKKLTRSFRIGFAFEVRATIETDPNIVLDEGQDVARTYTREGNTFNKNGRRRKEPNRSEYQAGNVDAPFPDPLPEADSHPEMVEDSYDHHPLNGFGDQNGPDGVQRFQLKAKGLVAPNQMVWFDQPGSVLRKGISVANGITYKAYFRAWMKPDIPPCQKFFYVEIIVDSDGKVTQNRLVMR